MVSKKKPVRIRYRPTIVFDVRGDTKDVNLIVVKKVLALAFRNFIEANYGAVVEMESAVEVITPAKRPR